MTETKPEKKARYVQWLKNEPGTNVPRLRIVVVNKAGPVVTDYLVLPSAEGYFLLKDDTKAVENFLYKIDTRWHDWTCTCADFRRHGQPVHDGYGDNCNGYECKHVAGLRAALAKRPNAGKA